VLDSETLLLSVVSRWVDDPQVPARLLALGDAAAILAMADGSLAALFTPAFGPARIGERMKALVEDNPGVHLKLAIVGGDAVLREQLPKGGGMLSRRAVQLFHLVQLDHGEEDEASWSLWTGGGARFDSPLGVALRAAGDEQLPRGDRQALAERVESIEVSPERRAEIEEHRSFVTGLRSRPRLTWGLLGVLAVVFMLEELWGGSETLPTLVRMGGNTEAALAGEPWRLLSSAVLHAGLFHVAVNGYVLLVLGGFMENVLGARRYAVLLGAAALGGSLASSLLSSATVAVGASGAIWGLLGAAAALAWRPGTAIPPSVVGPMRRNAIFNLVINLSVSFLPQVDLWAHLGGGLVGAALVLSGVLVRDLRPPGAGPGPSADEGSMHGRGWMIAALVTASLTVTSIAAAWTTDRPWRLAAALEYRAYDLDHGVELRAPTLLGAPQSEILEPNEVVWTIGDVIRDPLTLAVVITPHGLDAAELDERIASYVAQGPKTPAEAELVFAWRRAEGVGSPAFEVMYRYPNGLLSGLWIQLRDDVEVRVESLRWPGGGERWEAALAEIYSSLGASLEDPPP